MPTVAHLVGIPELGLRPVVARALDRPVRWVATSELVNPAPYLEGGELLLTTGLVEHDWADYVGCVSRAGVVALGFGIGLSHAEVPAPLIAAAGSAGLAVVAVPESTPFIAVSEAVARLLAQEERESTLDALAVQQELTRAISRPDGVGRVLAVLRRVSGGDAGLVDADATPIAPSRFRAGEPARRALRTLRADARRGAVTEVGGGETTVVQPLGVGGPYLVLTAPRPPGGVVRAALVTTVALLALDAERSRAAVDAELRLRDCAAQLVLGAAADAGRSVAALLDGAPALPSRIRVLRAVAVPDGARERLARTHPGALTTGGTDGTTAVLVDPDDAPAVEDRLAGLGCRVGTGPAVPPADAGLSDAAARTALASADHRAPVVRWDERFRGDVRAGLSAEAARALSAQILGDLTGEPELLRTLHAYLVHLGRWQPTADALGIHRNTLRKRISRIERITGRSVDTAAGRADLWVAVEIAREARDGRPPSPSASL